MIVLQLLIWFLPFSFINQVTQYVLIALNLQRHLTRAFIIGVLFNLLANLIFIPLYGYRAAAIITVFSEWALLIPFYILVRKNLCTVPWFDVTWRPTLAAAVMGAALWLIGDVNFLVKVVVAGVTYLVALASGRRPDSAGYERSFGGPCRWESCGEKCACDVGNHPECTSARIEG